MNIAFNINENFFIQFPELEISFSHIIKEYQSDSSRVMWALILDFHPKSMYKNIEVTERRQYIDVDYLGFHLDWEKHISDSNILKKFFLTKAEQYLVGWEEKLDERQQFITSIPYSAETFELLDKMMGVTEKLWKQYQVALKDVQEEESTTQGKAQESAGEQGLV